MRTVYILLNTFHFFGSKMCLIVTTIHVHSYKLHTDTTDENVITAMFLRSKLQSVFRSVIIKCLYFKLLPDFLFFYVV